MLKKYYLPVVILVLLTLSSSLTFAQNSIDSARVPFSFFQKISPRTARPGEFTSGGKTKNSGVSKAAATSGLPGIDSVVNWSDQFTAPGFDFNGNPQSVWPYTMVGHPPESGIPSFIGAPIIPVGLDLLGPDGKVAVFGGMPLHFGPSPAIVNAVVNSPVFQPWFY